MTHKNNTLKQTSNADIHINYFGLIKSTMSWAHVGREMVLALDAIGCNVSVTNCRGPLYNSALKIDSHLYTLMDRNRNIDIELTFEYPLNYPRLTGRAKIGFLVYETTKLPPLWVTNINRYLDLLIAPSTFCYDIMVSNGIPQDKIEIIPYGYNKMLFHDSVTPISFNTEKKFIFLILAMPHLRKGIDVLLDAYTETFTSNDAVSLIIKSPYQPFKNKKYWEINIEDIVKSYHSHHANIPEIIYINKEEDPALMPSYYAGCDCYLQPSLSEGFGIAILEAMAMRKPVITTAWGGHTYFCTKDNSFLIDYTLKNAGSAQYDTSDTESMIAYPDKDHLKQLMRSVYEKRDNANIKAYNGYESVKHLSWESAAHSLVRIIKERNLYETC